MLWIPSQIYPTDPKVFLQNFWRKLHEDTSEEFFGEIIEIIPEEVLKEFKKKVPKRSSRKSQNYNFGYIVGRIFEEIVTYCLTRFLEGISREILGEILGCTQVRRLGFWRDATKMHFLINSLMKLKTKLEIDTILEEFSGGVIDGISSGIKEEIAE